MAVNKSVIIAIIIAVPIIILAFSNSISLDTSQQNSEKIEIDVEKINPFSLYEIDTSMGSPIMGSTSAPITIVEFGDYQCPNCANWYANTKPQIVEKYIQTGTAKLFFIDFIVYGPDSQKASEATYCADEQGKYWEYHDILYSNQGLSDGGWANTENQKKFASQLQLDMELFDVCLDSDKYQNRVQQNVQTAIENGATGTPTFIIINSEGIEQKIGGPQPFSVFENVIDSML